MVDVGLHGRADGVTVEVGAVSGLLGPVGELFGVDGDEGGDVVSGIGDRDHLLDDREVL